MKSSTKDRNYASKRDKIDDFVFDEKRGKCF